MRASGGDRVGVLLGQSPETLIAHLATWKRGGISIPLFSLFGPDALAFRLADSGTKAVVTDAAGAEKLAAVRGELPDLAEVFVVGGGTGRDFWGEVEAATPVDPVPVRAEDPAVIIYTSGTTGRPRARFMPIGS